jgi:hypothetical protein
LAFSVSCFIILLLVFQSHSWALRAQKGIAKLQLFSLPTKHLWHEYMLNNLKILRQHCRTTCYKTILTLFFCHFPHFSTGQRRDVCGFFQQVFHNFTPRQAGLFGTHFRARQKVGQSQSLFLWRYMWSPDEQAEQASPASKRTTAIRMAVFFIDIGYFLPPLTHFSPFYCT